MTPLLVLLVAITTVPGGLGDFTPNDLMNNLTLGLEYGLFENVEISNSREQEFKTVAIASDAPRCAKIAKDILRINGATIAEATIAALFCYGAVNSGYSGIGGGLQLLHYTAKTKQSTVLISREKAPAGATEDMFYNDPRQAEHSGLAVAVPGEVKGMMELYKRFGGVVPWADLVKPTIDLLRGSRSMMDGNVTYPEVNCYRTKKNNKCIPAHLTQDRNALANTLQKIADTKGTAFYDKNHELAQSIIADIRDEGGIMTLDDLANFNVKWVTPVAVRNLDGGLTLHTAPPPAGGGALMALVLRVLTNFKNKSKLNTETAQYLTEALKHAFGARPNIGDPDDSKVTKTVNEAVNNLSQNKDYLNKVLSKISPTQTSQDRDYYTGGGKSMPPPDHGTAAFAIVGANGDAIVLTTTLNYYNGAFRGSRTGIRYNNQMNDFSYKRKYGEEYLSVANLIKAGKRPLSSATPAVFFNKNGQVRLVTAGIGGILIPSAVTTVVINNLYFGKSIKQALDAPRLHHVLSPMEIQVEYDYDSEIVSGLEAIGHQVRTRQSNYPGTACVGIARTTRGTLMAGFDGRKPGSLDGF